MRRRALVITLVITLVGAGACGDLFGGSERSVPPPADDGASDGAAPDGGDDGASDGASDDGASDGAAPDGGDAGCNAKPDCTRAVFVTNQTFTGELGGIAGADGKCNAAANASGHPRIQGRPFVAWVSDSSSSPMTSARFVRGTCEYVLPNCDVVARDWTQLVGGTLKNGINLDENGRTVPSGLVWTGTKADGSTTAPLSLNCNDWGTASSSYLGAQGNIGVIDASWTYSPSVLYASCDSLFHLYCFEK